VLLLLLVLFITAGGLLLRIHNNVLASHKSKPRGTIGPCRGLRVTAEDGGEYPADGLREEFWLGCGSRVPSLTEVLCDTAAAAAAAAVACCIMPSCLCRDAITRSLDWSDALQEP
jgi:hypothetical protein